MPVVLSDAAIRYICTNLPSAPVAEMSEESAVHAEIFAALHRLNQRGKKAHGQAPPSAVTVQSVVNPLGSGKLQAVKDLRMAANITIGDAKAVIEGAAPRVTYEFPSLDHARAFIAQYPAAFEIAP